MRKESKDRHVDVTSDRVQRQVLNFIINNMLRDDEKKTKKQVSAGLLLISKLILRDGHADDIKSILK